MAKTNIVRKACELVGGQTAMQKKLGLKSQGSVSRWIVTKRIPVNHVLKVEELTGISRHELRPDIYPSDSH